MKADSVRVKRLLNTVRGQIDGIIKMFEQGRDYVEIVNQVMASKAILDRVNKELLSAHLINSISGNGSNPSEEKLAEIRDLLNKIL